ncbi:MAG: hypothetical protein ACI8UP_004940 [Porticoccaceae bacterium]|jgi:hypothetical protein
MGNEELIETFQTKGYVVIDSGQDENVLDATVADLRKFFGPDRIEPIHTPYYGPGRIQDAWHISQNVLSIAQSNQIAKTLLVLYGQQARPFQTLNFYKGTEQPVHADSIHFNSEPFGAMCGVWTALEDVGENQGPLIYYPGSHRLPEMNYSDFDLVADQSSYPAYLQKIQEIIVNEGYVPEYGILKKGQSLVWSANILHGGSLQKDKELTRHSQVTHYFIGNPKCWTPSKSNEGRSYFEPEKIRDVQDQPFQFPLTTRLETIKKPIHFRHKLISAIKRRLHLKH